MYLREQTAKQSDRSEEKGASKIIMAMHYPPAKVEGRKFTRIMQEYGVTQCVYRHLHGMSSISQWYQGEHGGMNYKLVSLDYLGARPKAIYDSERKCNDK